MVADPAYHAEAKKRRLRVIPSTGEQIQKVVNDAFKGTDPKTVARACTIIFPKKKC